MKDYYLNALFAIKCGRVNGYCLVEVYNHSLPFYEVLEGIKTKDSVEANKFYLQMREKYKYCDDIIIE